MHIFVSILLVLIFLPFLLIIIPLTISFYCFLYKWWNFEDFQKLDTRTFWHKPIINISKFTKLFGSTLNGYDIVGLDNIPETGPALLIIYHGGPMPLDAALIASHLMLYKKRKMIAIVDRLAFKIPGFKTALAACECVPGTRESLVELLRRGNLVLIYPGGVREAIFSSSNYELIWNERKGFANVAIEAKVPIIPLFTQNTRQIHFILNIGKGLFRFIYERYKIMFLPFAFGLLPVKLRTFIGDPIPYDKNRSVDELFHMTKASVEKLIRDHQRRPGNIFFALIDRFTCQSVNELNFNKHKIS